MNSEQLEIDGTPFLQLPDIIPGELTPVSINPNQIYRLQFKEYDYFCTSCGGLDPCSFYTSMAMEKNIREKWWNIQPGDYVLDIGSHYGSYTLSALAMGASLVIAVDPDRFSYFDLETNLVLNGFNLRCVHTNFMIGKEIGVCEYYPDSHSNRKENNPCEGRLSTTIDRLRAMFMLPKLDWIKIDVEGMELDVLEGANETLKYFKPKLLIENHECFIPGISDKIKEYLEPLGYEEDRNNSELGCWSLWTPLKEELEVVSRIWDVREIIDFPLMGGG